MALGITEWDTLLAVEKVFAHRRAAVGLLARWRRTGATEALKADVDAFLATQPDDMKQGQGFEAPGAAVGAPLTPVGEPACKGTLTEPTQDATREKCCDEGERSYWGAANCLGSDGPVVAYNCPTHGWRTPAAEPPVVQEPR
jgi:hypothetical protein